jgi:alpha-tubulin suppressor-like RCC1 family protein
MRRLIPLVLVAAALALAAPAGAAPAPLRGVAAVTVGRAHTCAMTTTNQVRCWGRGNHGQLGTNGVEEHTDAVTTLNSRGTAPLTGVRSVGTGDDFTCALLLTGQVRCWGVNDRGQLGRGGDDLDRLLPVPVRNVAGTGNLTGATQLSVGYDHACVVLTSRQVRCWGENDDGEVGADSTSLAFIRPTVVRAVDGPGPLTGVTKIDAGDDHTCALLATGELRCWGWGPGTGANTAEAQRRPVVTRDPTDTGPLTGVTQVGAGGHLTCARLSNGQARCWGDNGVGELGIGVTGGVLLLPAVVGNPEGTGPLTSVTSVSAGDEFTCARTNAGGGRLWCWGENTYGQVGGGAADGIAVVRPQVVLAATGTGALSGVTQVAASAFHTCARLSNGQARCWGIDDHGELGDGSSSSDQPLPQVVLA